MSVRESQSDATEIVDGAVTVKRRREGRGWGPFSGGQLTTIIVTLAVVIGFPIAANAVVQGSNVFLTNPNTGVHAAVSAAGALAAAPSPPGQLFHSPVTIAIGANACTKVVDSNLAYPEGGGGAQAEVITEIHAAVSGLVGQVWSLYRSATCSGGAMKLFQVESTPGGSPNYKSMQILFPSGLAIPKGQGLYVKTSADATGKAANVIVSASGYLVRTIDVPANG